MLRGEELEKRPIAARLKKIGWILTFVGIPFGSAIAGIPFLLAGKIMAREKGMEKDILVFLTILLPIIFLFSVFNASQKWITLSSVVSLGIMIYAVFLGADYLIREEKFFHLLIKLLILSAIISAAYALIIYFSGFDIRAQALFAGPNILGEVMFFSIIWTLAFSIHIYQRRKWVLVPSLLMMSLALVFSLSRGAWLGAMGALIVYGLWQRRARLWIAILLLVVGTFLVGLPALRSRLDTIFNISHPLNVERIYIWRATLNMIRAHPWLGIGMGNYAFVYKSYMIRGAEIETPSFAHNIFLQMWAEGGLGALLVFLGIVYLILRKGIGWIRSSRGSSRVLAAASFSALVGVIIHNQVDCLISSMHIGPVFFLLAGMIFYGERFCPGKTERQKQTTPPS